MKSDPAVTHFPTPIVDKIHCKTDEEKIAYIAERFHEIMEVMGMDMEDPSLAHTPRRVAKMYIKEVFSGLDPKNFPEVNFFPDDFHHELKGHLVLSKVSFTSFCEHHFVPMEGVAYVGYIPNGKIIGLSKIPRIVRYFARRPQLQERLTAQIADSLSILLDTENIAVSITARHFCVIARGIEDAHSQTVTNVLRGSFEDDEILRKEFFEGINRKD